MPDDKTAEEAAAKMRAFSPDLMDLTFDFLLGDIWKRPGLSPRDRSLVTVAALIATHRPGQLGGHLKLALTNGVTRDELQEVFIQMAFYAGWPSAMTAVDVAMQALDDV